MDIKCELSSRSSPRKLSVHLVVTSTATPSATVLKSGDRLDLYDYAFELYAMPASDVLSSAENFP